MRALVAAREVDAPDWLIGAGAIRTAAWDRLHGFESPTPLADIDLGFFDRNDLSEARDDEIQSLLEQALPGVRWDAKNQAAVHLWYPQKFGYAVEPFDSSAAAVATWPETAACVALRLACDDQLLIHAPLGLEDLFNMVWRRNPRRVSVEEYQRRLATKRIAEKWPRVTIMGEDLCKPKVSERC
ncbi:MAG TPA: nucleotidyltransferase family protein [Solirubrobacteraceae bacterium]